MSNLMSKIYLIDSSHWLNDDAGKAPDCWAITLPCLNTIRVGIDRILNWAARACCSSVLSLPKRNLGSHFLAAWVNTGAKFLHGPHQLAQKSTTSSNSDLLAWWLKLTAVSSIGSPTNRLCLHFPQVGCCSRRSSGTRFKVSQWGQAIIMIRPHQLHYRDSSIINLVGVLNE